MTNEGLSIKVAELSRSAWSIADTLWTAVSKSDVRDFILPLMVIRRIDCLLEGSKREVLAAAATLPEGIHPSMRDRRLYKATGLGLKVYNTAPFTFIELKNQDPARLYENLIDYIKGFPEFLQDVFIYRFQLPAKLKKIEEKDKLYAVFEKICTMNLHPSAVTNLEMGYLYEDLIQKFNEEANEDAGDHYTPREVVRLIAKLLLNNDRAAIQGDGVIRTFYDGTCGTGGMLSIAEEEAKDINPRMSVELYGQQLKDDSYAVCVTDMLIKGQDPTRIKLGDTLKNDMHADKKFHFCLANPPYGSDWKDARAIVDNEHDTLGFNGRFGAGTPRVSDGQLLFVQHFASKLRDDGDGGRAGIVLNASPLNTGGAGSGESEIRRWLLEHDLLEGIIALPMDMFYNTGIATYVWILNNRKPPERRGIVRLLDASGPSFWRQLRKSIGSKKREIPDEAISQIVDDFYLANAPGNAIDVFNSSFGYRELTIERPFTAEQNTKKKITDPELRIVETIPLDVDPDTFLKEEIATEFPGSWINHKKTKVGYEINFTRYFFKPIEQRSVTSVESDIVSAIAMINLKIGGATK